MTNILHVAYAVKHLVDKQVDSLLSKNQALIS